MRRVLIVASAVALLVLLIAPAALAASGSRPLDRIPSRALATLFAPRVVTDGPLTVTGAALTPAGSPAAGANVEWGYYDTPGHWVYGNTVQADAAGRYTFTGVIVTTQGTLDVYPAGSEDVWGREPVAFSAGPAAGAYDIAPGSVTFGNTDRTGVDYASIRVYTSGTAGYCRTIITSQSAQVAAMPPNVDYAVARYRDGLDISMGGVEWWAGSIPVSPSALAAGSITVSEKEAHWMWIKSPYWGSGAPGTKVTLILDNWPTPMTAEFWASPGWPNATDIIYSGTFHGTSTGEAGFVTLKVPNNAKPGYAYDFRADRTDAIPVNGGHSLLASAGFEVCTLKASPASVSRGGAVKLKGVVPTQGHEGSKAGLKKKITVYSRTTATKAQPTDWNAAKKGWKKLADVRTNGLGAYSFTARPQKTTWYIVRYPGDDWYYGGYTAVIKVTVR